MPRLARDITHCLTFVAAHPFGKPLERRRDIFDSIERIRRHPKANRIGARRSKTGVELRRQHGAQFVIIYAYFEPSAVTPGGVVSVRAVRHRRVRDPFIGVKDIDT